MFKTLFRAGAGFLMWQRWLRQRLKGLLISICLVVAVVIGHSEYLTIVELSGDDRYLRVSFFLKWFFIVLIVAGYFWSVERQLNKRVRLKQASDINRGDRPESTDPSGSLRWGNKKKRQTNKRVRPKQASEINRGDRPESNDPFEYLRWRNKKKLQSRVEKKLKGSL